MTTRMERLEAALRELFEATAPLVGVARVALNPGLKALADKTIPAFDAAQEALAESGPSCCEETRERTLKEAAELCFHEEISSRCQFCSNYAVVLPMDAPGKPCGHESPSGAAKCELESGHQGTHIGSAKEGNTVRWLPPTTPPQANKGATEMNDWAPECEKECADGGECAYYCHRAAHAKSEANKGATNPAPAIPVKPACGDCGGSGKKPIGRPSSEGTQAWQPCPCGANHLVRVISAPIHLRKGSTSDPGNFAKCGASDGVVTINPNEVTCPACGGEDP